MFALTESSPSTLSLANIVEDFEYEPVSSDYDCRGLHISTL